MERVEVMSDGRPDRSKMPKWIAGADDGNVVARAVDQVKQALPGVANPLPGGILSVLLSYCPGVARRRHDEVLDELRIAFNNLVRHGAGATQLFESDAFFDASIRVVQAAMRTHSQTKRTALWNCLQNCAVLSDSDETRTMMFIGMIDVFTEHHILLLEHMARPEAWAPTRGSETAGESVGSYSRLDDHDLRQQIAVDLHAKGLIEEWAMKNLDTFRDTRLVTPYGNAFLRYIREPQ